MDNFRGARAVLSGPAGGVVGYALTGSRETDMPLIGFDMGGTSTDVSRYAGTYEHVIESTTAGVTIQAPQLDINTVAAGGGSQLFFRSGIFVVGPESAGSHPGPTCYKKGGPLTVTDANLMLGRILPEYFPKIFGPKENEPLDYELTRKKFGELQVEINAHLKASGDSRELTIEQVALGFIRVANETMCRPIRALTQSRGLDTASHVLSCFGGAGGQHACSIARNLGITKVSFLILYESHFLIHLTLQVLVHKYAGVLSAYGMALADVVNEVQEPSGVEFSESNAQLLKERLDALSKQCQNKLEEQGFRRIELQPFLHLRYDGTDGALMCAPGSPQQSTESPLIAAYGDFNSTFLERYRNEFGFVLQNRRIIVDDIRIRGLGKNETPPELEVNVASEITPKSDGNTQVHFDEGEFSAPIYLTKNLLAGHQVSGPAVLIDQLSTIIVEPECSVQVTNYGDLVMEVKTGGKQGINEQLDPVHLSIFSHRFMSIAEQMGRWALTVISQLVSLFTYSSSIGFFNVLLYRPTLKNVWTSRVPCLDQTVAW